MGQLFLISLELNSVNQKSTWLGGEEANKIR